MVIDFDLWETMSMPSLENDITRILSQARKGLTPAEIADRINSEPRVAGNYTEREIRGWLEGMPNVYAEGEKYHRKPEDASQAAARIGKEATENH